MDTKLVKVIKGESLFPPPIWMMRQAGRYLPEYKHTRETAGSFLKLCYTPVLAAEVTLQPIRRFGFDAAILFSDILVVPHALGRDLRFEENQGPVMTPLTEKDIEKLDVINVIERLSPSFETIERVRSKLDDKISLIGFCGAPWTVATYMIAGHGTFDQASARLFSYFHPQAMNSLLECLIDVSVDYLLKQINAGADVIQIFDSWAGALDNISFERMCIQPVQRMVKKIRQIYPEIPIIGFPRGANLFYKDYAEKTGITALGLDWSVPLFFAERLQKDFPVQGNLDPMRLVAGGDALDCGVDAILAKLGKGPLIFNLGHGIIPNTPIKHVEQMIKRVRRNQINN
ncbi:MAG: uroporphyrinogen decarboxylase [Candidatus Tokpelaia sp. JSC189]|nr:MAG: uroporphyrinogen decarboxylase [Candidatus Tokpelaia sp. JSC189]